MVKKFEHFNTILEKAILGFTVFIIGFHNQLCAVYTSMPNYL